MKVKLKNEAAEAGHEGVGNDSEVNEATDIFVMFRYGNCIQSY
jgi:hypothetical protein